MELSNEVEYCALVQDELCVDRGNRSLNATVRSVTGSANSLIVVVVLHSDHAPKTIDKNGEYMSDEWTSSTSGVKYISILDELEMDGASSLSMTMMIEN